jgi:exopolysaccharide biosynthesis polyprenyl glycosylphosphotransferase
LKRREQFKRLIMFCASVLIISIQVGLFAYMWYEHYGMEAVIKVDFYRRGNWAVIALYAVLIFFFYKVYGAFKVGYLRILDVLYSQVLSILCVNIITYVQLALIGRWRWLSNIRPMITLTILDITVAIIWGLFVRWIYAQIYPPRQLLFIYGEKNPEDLIRKISTRKDKYTIRETIHINEGEEKIKEKMSKYQNVLIGDISSQYRNRFLKFCFEKSIRCYTIPKISDIISRNASEIHLFDTPLLLSRNHGLLFEQKFIKRIVDIVVSLIAILVFSPLLLIIAILVKCYDKGPILYKQERLTLDGKTFNVFKFRSMGVDSEKDGARLAMKNDSRVTPVGKVLRNLHFDEFPQLFNILKGDMSLVGPRPERPVIMTEYEKEIPEFKYRLKVKAGLTGYAQVYGKYNTTPYDKLKLDLTYIETYSIWLDIKLLMLTVKILFQEENTEGVDEGQKTAVKK